MSGFQFVMITYTIDITSYIAKWVSDKTTHSIAHCGLKVCIHVDNCFCRLFDKAIV